MELKYRTLSYIEYKNLGELEKVYEDLAKQAIEETKRSYAPYSNFFVGAAVLLEDGTVVSANNQENAAFPSGLCAERVAIFYAMAKNPGKRIKCIAIAASVNGELCNEPVYPCGACRQVMAEYRKNGGEKIQVITLGKSRIEVFADIDSLLPFSFSDIPSDSGF